MDEAELIAKVLALDNKYEMHMAQFEEFKSCNSSFREETRQFIKEIKEEQTALNKIASSIEVLAYQMKDIHKKVEETNEAQKRLESSLTEGQSNFESKFEQQIVAVDSKISKLEQSDTDKKAAFVDGLIKTAGGMLLGAVLLLIFKTLFPALPF